jgi:hypothetical protein
MIRLTENIILATVKFILKVKHSFPGVWNYWNTLLNLCAIHLRGGCKLCVCRFTLSKSGPLGEKHIFTSKLLTVFWILRVGVVHIMATFRAFIPYSTFGLFQHFGGMYCLHLWGDRFWWLQIQPKAAHSSKTAEQTKYTTQCKNLEADHNSG